MRADLTPAVARACAEATRPTLVFDVARLEANFERFRAAARANDVTLLFAAKSFAHPRVWEMAARWCDGFDAGSTGELAALPPTRILSIADPTGRARASSERVILSCDSAAQVAHAPPHMELALRVSASITDRDPAIGAVLDGTGHRRSRFGVERDGLRALLDSAAGRDIGLHVHHGPVTAASADRFLTTARAALALAAAHDVTPRFLDLGGAWHGIADLAATLAQLRAALPASLELIIEPGRALALEAGFATGTITGTRELADRRLCTTDLSRLCHLRWSPVDLVGPAPHPGTGTNHLVVGATCSEDDVIGEWTTAPDALRTGTRLVLRGVTGYAAGWNTSFGGIPAADIVFA